MPNRVARHAQDIREDQIDRLTAREQMLKVVARQRGEQTVCRATVFRELHLHPCSGGNPTGGTRALFSKRSQCRILTTWEQLDSFNWFKAMRTACQSARYRTRTRLNGWPPEADLRLGRNIHQR